MSTINGFDLVLVVFIVVLAGRLVVEWQARRAAEASVLSWRQTALAADALARIWEGRWRRERESVGFASADPEADTAPSLLRCEP